MAPASKKRNTYKRGATSSASLSENYGKSITFWAVMGIAVLFLLWAPFQAGLFDGYTYVWDRALFSAYMWTGITLVALGMFLFFHWRYDKERDTASLLVWLLPLCYLLSLTQAASPYYAKGLIYLHIMYATFFLIASQLTKEKLGNRLLTWTLMITGYLIVIYGLLSWLGNTHTSGLSGLLSHLMTQLARNDAVMMDTNGYRLTAAFQYANSYAGYLIPLFLGAAFLIVRSKKTTAAAANALMLVPIFLSFFLTLSRGALVVLPIVMLLMLFFLPVYRQILLLVHTGIAGVATIVILSKVTTLGQGLQQAYKGSQSREGWLLIIGASLLSAILITLIQRFAAPWLEQKLTGFNRRRYAHILLPAIAIVVGTLGAFLLFSDTGATKLLPSNVRTRIENINFQQHSVLERGTFYKDAFKMFKDYPLLGTGGGGWAALYQKYQNNPYSSMQAHSSIMQYLVEIGLIGVIALLLLLVYVFVSYIRHYVKQSPEEREARFVYAIFAMGLLIHSVIDFDLSYGYFGLLVFLCLGGMASAASEREAFLKGRLSGLLPYLRSGFPIVLGVVGLVVFILSAQLLRGNALFQSAQADASSGKGSFDPIMAKVNDALSLQANPAYYQLKISLLDEAYQQTKQNAYEQQSLATIAQLKKVEPNLQLTMQEEYQHALMRQDEAAALQIMQQVGLVRYPWDITVYENVIQLDTDLGEKARVAKNFAEMDQKWDQALEYYKQVLEKMKRLELLPKGQNQGREFDITNKIAVALGQIYFERGDYTNALAVLKNHLTDDFSDTPNDPQLKQARMTQARWYIATLRKLGQDDPNLFSKLVAKDPQENNRINMLVNTDFNVK